MEKILVTILLILSLMIVSCGEDTGNTGDTGDMFNPEDCTGNFPHYHAGLCWSDPSPEMVDLKTAGNYCADLGGWFPNIQELRMLIQNCPQTEYPQPVEQEDWCKIKDPEKLSLLDITTACSGCTSNNTGKYSVFGDTGWFWSSSACLGSEHLAWCVYFDSGRVTNNYKANNHSVICVR